MIVRSGQPFTLRDLFDRFGLISIQRRVDRYCRPRLNRRRHTFAVLGVWSLLSDLAGRSAVHLRDRPERFRRFCPDCREDTERGKRLEFTVIGDAVNTTHRIEELSKTAGSPLLVSAELLKAAKTPCPSRDYPPLPAQTVRGRKEALQLFAPVWANNPPKPAYAQ